MCDKQGVDVGARSATAVCTHAQLRGWQGAALASSVVDGFGEEEKKRKMMMIMMVVVMGMKMVVLMVSPRLSSAAAAPGARTGER